MVLRKGLTAAAAAGAVAFALVGLIGVGTYAASGAVQSGGTGVALAPGTVPAAYQGLIQQWGTLCPQISPPMLAAQLYQESGFDPSARSPVGALGIAQFMPATWATYGVDGNGDGKKDIWDPADAIPSAATYDCALARDTAGVPGDPQANLLAAYNAGPYAVISAQGVPAYQETQGYVRSITSLTQSFAAPVSAVAVSAQASGAIYFAQTKLGTPYLWGGEGLASQGGQFDCSGLTQAAYASVGITLPRVANDQWYAGQHPSRDQLRPGDLVFFATNLNDPRTIHHVGIYVGGGYMINAPHTGAVIRYDKIDQPDYIGATRVTQDGAAALPVRGSNGSITGGSVPGSQS
ncbi:cell wall-associated NlpC family hydrolase [Kitasatospora sp. MAP12-15]|uniref:C40 family peptidase n=1 Tax=unclassified Kitasatospora TaxID=2633591 RepID=UPI0024751383|nr:bifunctional lytic transglycosylase/C40 family peptidase [Kitasatospora sp. MAP12-44]MDH6112208.1 cell wall-associated NlpC family hydrolase [Kitasatospora sp. MAP12-44]